MLLTRRPQAFEHESFRWEIKFDGFRTMAHCTPEATRLIMRGGRDWTDRFPSVAASFRQLALSYEVVLDGEMIAGTGDVASFVDVASRRSRHVFVVFDVLRFRGRDLTERRLEERRRILDRIGIVGDALVVSRQYVDGPALFREVERHGYEGVVGKRVDSLYLPGKRSPHWVKVKTPLGARATASRMRVR